MNGRNQSLQRIIIRPPVIGDIRSDFLISQSLKESDSGPQLVIIFYVFPDVFAVSLKPAVESNQTERNDKGIKLLIYEI